MTRNWNKVRARLADPFEPDWESVDQQIEAMIAEQDARGGHVYPPFRLPDPPPSASSPPAARSSSLAKRPKPTRAGSTDATPTPMTTPSNREAADSQETWTHQQHEQALSRGNPSSTAVNLDNALTTSRRSAFRKTKGEGRQEFTESSQVDQPPSDSSHKERDPDYEEQRGQEDKRRS
ncbi:hypothetical protein diail_9725 [Diaporthe ilicicola]|nr:hypothetical protein diail_9725 [Diaporthe ilicicola]